MSPDSDKSSDFHGNAAANTSTQPQEQPAVVSYQGKLPAEIGTDYTFKREIVWKNAIGFLALHLIGLYGFHLIVHSAKVATTVFMAFVVALSGEGITVGAHRLYSHKAFKATKTLKFILMVAQTIAGENCMYIWVRDHRLHHKYSDTDADPHNANRGFFFSHMGWLMSKKHPAVIEKGKLIDMSDLEADPFVMFQKKYYKPLYVLFAMIFPIGTPVWLWGESLYNAFVICFFTRYVLILNITWSVNSVAHIIGTKPFDKFMLPVESYFVSFISWGEGWHNYHHAFPWDYRASELGAAFSVTTMVIDICAKLGLAYDLKTASETVVGNRAIRTGDGSHPVYGTDAAAKKKDDNDDIVEEPTVLENEVVKPLKAAVHEIRPRISALG